MKFSEVYADPAVKSALRGMADTGRVPGAMLLHENDGGGALALVLAFLQYLDCGGRSGEDSCGECLSCSQHSHLVSPDVKFVFPVASGGKVSGEAKDMQSELFTEYWKALVKENPYFVESELSAALGLEKKAAQIGVTEGKAILKKLSLAPYGSGYRAIVVYLPEKMNRQTANMLLKSIEEPQDRTVFILITHHPEDVLQTVASRCLRIRIPPVPKETVADALCRLKGMDSASAAAVADFAGGSVGEALRTASEDSALSAMRQMLTGLLDAICARDLMAALDAGETLASMDSRERQRAFCTFAGGTMRKLFFLQQGLDSLSGAMPQEAGYLSSVAKKLPRTFPRRALDAFSNADMLIERNVGQKTLFADLVCRLFTAGGAK